MQLLFRCDIYPQTLKTLVRLLHNPLGMQLSTMQVMHSIIKSASQTATRPEN